MGSLPPKGPAISPFPCSFFLNAYIPAGIEFASELTYPTNESTTTGLLTAASQTLGKSLFLRLPRPLTVRFAGVIFTLALSEVNQSWGTIWSLLIQIGLLVVGCVLTALVPNNLRRQQAFNKGAHSVQFIAVPQEESLPMKN